MKTTRRLAVLVMTLGVLAWSGAAQAQTQPRLEVGSSMAGMLVGLGDNDGTLIGVPSSSFGLLDSGVYASLFVGTHLTIEPRVGLFWISTEGDSSHVLNLTGQASYFLSGTTRPSLYVLAAAGMLDTSGDDTSPKTIAGGLGYRVPVGDNLVFRLDGRYLHATDDGGNQLLVTLSIGGVFR